MPENGPSGNKLPLRWRMRVEHEVTAVELANAIAIEARDRFDDEDAQARFCGQMSREDALRALRAALWAYGDLSWPDDLSERVVAAARQCVEAWT
jgi:hypothetical protein